MKILQTFFKKTKIHHSRIPSLVGTRASLLLNTYLRFMSLEYVVQPIVKSVDNDNHTKGANRNRKRHQDRRYKGKGFARYEEPIKALAPTFFRVHDVSKRRPHHCDTNSNQRFVAVLDIRDHCLRCYQQDTIGKQQTVIYECLYDLITERGFRSECAAGIDDIHQR